MLSIVSAFLYFLLRDKNRAHNAHNVKWRLRVAGRTTVIQRGVVLHFYPLKTIPCQGCAELRPSLPAPRS